MRIHCDFDFQYYPAETQKCDIRLRSCKKPQYTILEATVPSELHLLKNSLSDAHNSSELELKWRRPIGVFLVSPDDENFDITIDHVRRFQIVTQVGHKGKS